MKNAELILLKMQSRHAPEEPQQLGSEKFSVFNLYLIIICYLPLLLILAQTDLSRHQLFYVVVVVVIKLYSDQHDT